MVELVAKRYGTAIFELAIETNQVDAIYEQLLWVKDVLTSQDEFVKLLNHPKVGMGHKINMMEDTFGEHVSKDILGLFVIAIRKGREQHLLDIIDYCLEEIDDYKGIAKAYVESASTLTEEQVAAIKDKLEASTKKQVMMHVSVNEDLIGGLVIRIGDRIVDNSIKGKITAITKDLYAVH